MLYNASHTGRIALANKGHTMKQTIYFSDFCDGFHKADRGTQFTYDGMRVLFDWLEEYEHSNDEELEFDVISLCCEYSEDCAEDIIGNYCLEEETADMTEEEKRDYVRDYLNENTMLCGETAAGDFVYLQF